MSEIYIYVDGSYDPWKNVYGYSFVALLPSGEVATYSSAGDNPSSLKMRNVSGEMLAAMSAVAYAVREKHDKVIILYDYLGIECWATGTWKAKKPLTRQYAEFMKEKKKEIKIQFEKVPAHANVKYNEIADTLAKKAVCDFCK